MADQHYHIEYTATALEHLRSLPKREADQILRRILRLERGWHGKIKRLQNVTLVFGCECAIIGFYLMCWATEFWFKRSEIERTFMISAPVAKSTAKTQRKNVIAQISSLREQMEDLNDYLDLLEARARNKGKRTFTTQEVRKHLGLV